MWLGDMQAAATATVTDPVKWYNVVGQFKKQTAKFNAAWSQLMNLQPFVAAHPTLQADYNALVSTGQSIKSKIQSATGLIDQTMSMAGNIWSSIANTFTNVFGEVEAPQLGFLPLIPIAVIAASVTAISYFVYEVYKFQTRVDQIKKMEAQGVSAQQAIATASNMQPGVLSQVKGIALPIAGVVALLAVLRFVNRGE